jgi:uncharacterized protein YjbI with pentapeptide repeats
MITYKHPYIVNEPNFEKLINKMAQYKGVNFKPQYFKGYTINTLKNENTLDNDKTKRFLIEHPHFVDCNFTNTQILEFDSNWGKYDNCNFTNSVLKDCYFYKTVFTGCNFTGAIFHSYTTQNRTDTLFNECIFDNSNIKIASSHVDETQCYRFANCSLKNADIKIISSHVDENQCYIFINCSLKNADISNCNILNKVTFKHCDTSGTKFKNCEIYELDSDYLFRVKFLIKGGKILKNTSTIDKGLSWIGQNINPFC